MNEISVIKPIIKDIDIIIDDVDDYDLLQEKNLVIADFCQNGSLYPIPYEGGTEIKLVLLFQSNKLVINFLDDVHKKKIIISLSPYLRFLREYREICGVYKHALNYNTAPAIETIDMARRGLHNQAADLIQERLKDKIAGNHQAFRLLFTVMTFQFWNKLI